MTVMDRFTRHRSARVLGLALTLTSVAAASASIGASGSVAAPVAPRAAATTALATPPGVTIQGKGFGHGHGLSQYGAYGAASQGVPWTTIVGHYYPGTVLTAIGNPLIRVDTRSDLGQMAFAPASGLRVSYGAARTGLAALPAVGSDNSPIRMFSVVPADGTNAHLVYSTQAGGSGTVGPASPQINVTSTTGAVVATARTAGRFGTIRGEFRGVMSGGAVVPVAAIPMDEYLRGVVPHESPASWPAGALAAQAVAARSYAAYGIAHPRAAGWDICDSTACQVFQAHDYYASTDAAVQATAGQALRYGGQPAFTEFTASTGGWNAAGSAPYLKAQADPWDVTPANPYNAWTASLPVATLQSRWPTIGTFQSLSIVSRDGAGTWGGRVVNAVLTGSAGSVTVSGATLQAVFGLRSTYFDVVQTRPDLTGVSATGGTGGAVGIQTLLGASSFGVATAKVSAALTGVDPSQWRFLPGRRSDGVRPDLVAVRLLGGSSGRVEVTTATSASSYQTLTRAVTPFPAVAPDTTVQALAGRAPGDLCLVLTGSTGSKSAELHCLSAASGYASWVLHAATPLPQSVSPTTSRFLMVPTTGDLVWIPFASTGSGRPELHRVSASSGYHSWVDHKVLPLGMTTASASTFALASSGSGAAPDLLYVPMAGTGSGRVEVHVISASSGYLSFSLHAATPVPATTFPAYQPFLG